MSEMISQIYADYVMKDFPNQYQLSGDGVGVSYIEDDIRCEHDELNGKVIGGCYAQEESNSACSHATSGVGKIASTGIEPYSRGIAPDVFIRGGSCAAVDPSTDALCSASISLFGGGIGIWRDTSICPAGSEIDPSINIVRYYDDEVNGNYNAYLDNYIQSNPGFGVAIAAGNGSGNSADPALSTYPSSSELAAGHYHRDCAEIFYDPHSPTRDYPFDGLSTGASSKNVITVGDVTILEDRYTIPYNARVSGYSSRGPTDDGRIKPDIAAPVYNQDLNPFTSLSCGISSYTQYFTGTSAATPVVSGIYALLFEMQKDNFASPFLSSTYKAMLNHSAFEVGNNPGPDFEAGWGVVNAYGSVTLLDQEIRSASSTIIESELLSLNDAFESQIRAGFSGEPVKVSLAWVDPAGVSCRTSECGASTLVNDLDLIVTDSQENRYYPWTLNASSPFDAAVQDHANAIDNYEQVKISNPILGETYTIRVVWNSTVIGSSSQSFSLVKSNWLVDSPPLENSLPIEFGHINISKDLEGISLNWTTLSERNNSHFLVQRSVGSGEYREVGEVMGFGFSETERSYDFLDSYSYPKHSKISYRIKQMDFDGSFVFSPEVEIDTGIPLQDGLIDNYPNPISVDGTLSFELGSSSKVNIELVDTTGRLVKTLFEGDKSAGQHQLRFHRGSLPAGVYFVLMKTRTGLQRKAITIN